MAVKICHASLSENGNAGWDGKAKVGDQTGREVCTRDWYNKPWDVMLRYKDYSIAKKAATIAKKLADSNLVGYDQSQRNTLYNKLKSYNWDVDKYIASKVKTETDCSAFVYACYCCLIPELRSSENAPTTSTMKSKFTSCGFTAYTADKYTSQSSYLLIGDILVKSGTHTVMSISQGANASAPSSNSSNTSYVGKGIGTAIALSNMNVRTGAGTNYSICGSISANEKVEVLSKLSSGWYKIVWTKCSNGYAYVSNTTGTYFKYSENITVKKATKAPASKSTTFEGTYKTTGSVNLRNGAGTSYSILTTLSEGVKVKTDGSYTNVNGVKWLYVSVTINSIKYIGFVSSKYLQKV